MTGSAAALLEAASTGDRVALARLLSLVERGGDAARDVGRAAHPRSGRAYTVGITGAPGAGKSTLTDALLRLLRGRGERVAVVAVDPSSPFTGGAILGDRIRMQDHATDEGVYIRSMATRGHLGGLALATGDAIRVLDAAGWPLVLVETVGVGQVEVEVVGAADTSLVVVNPGWGDAVQASKAGLMEIADVFVVNKADRPGADDSVRDLERMLDMGGPRGWRPPVVKASASEGSGIDAVWAAVQAHRAHLESSGGLEQARRARARDELARLVAQLLLERARGGAGGERFEALAADVAARRADPWTAAEAVAAETVAREAR